MTEEQKGRVRELVGALRSGEFKQAIGTLRRDDHYCCLGVGCVIAQRHGLGEWRKDEDDEYYFAVEAGGFRSYSVLPTDVAAWFGFDFDPMLVSSEKRIRQPATFFNDNLRLSFEEIADLFERTYLKEG